MLLAFYCYFYCFSCPFCCFCCHFAVFLQAPRGYKAWDADGLGEDKLVEALKLVLGEKPVSARQACRDIFGEKFPNVHRTLGNLYKRKFGESIALAKRLSAESRKQRLKIISDEWIIMGKPGNPSWKPYLTADEEKLIVSFLKTCNFMHMPFNRDAFKVSIHACMYTHIYELPPTHTCTHVHHTYLLTTHTRTRTQGLVCSIAKANGAHDNPVASNYYVREFLKRHPGLTELKTSSVGHHRAKQATKKVRDAVFKKLQVSSYATRLHSQHIDLLTTLIQDMLDRLVASEVLTAYERDYELDKLTWYYDEMGGGVEGKRNKVLGSAPVAGKHYRSCVVTTGDTQDAFHTSMGIFANNHLLDKAFMIQRLLLTCVCMCMFIYVCVRVCAFVCVDMRMCVRMRMFVHVCVCMYVSCVRITCVYVCVQIYRFHKHVRASAVCALYSGATVNKNNAENIPDDWGCGATKNGSMTVDLFMSLCVHHVKNNLEPKGYGAGKKASILVFDGHSSRWSYAGLLYLMANNCWPFCLASHTSSWAQVCV